MEYRSPRTILKMIVGFILTQLLPQKTRKIKRSFALQYWGRGIGRTTIGKRIESVIRFYLAYSNKNQGDKLEKSHKHFWKREINLQWYEKSAQRFARSTLPVLQPHINILKTVLENVPIFTVCEIGTGDGMFLNYLRNTLNSPTCFIGLDLCADRMALNVRRYTSLHFLAVDALEWIRNESTDNTLYVTNGGVLEYSSQISLITLFHKIKSEQPGSVIALFHESLAPGHQLSSDYNSHLTNGGEFSFSHNYSLLLQEAGFQVNYFKEENHPAGYRAQTIIATSSEQYSTQVESYTPYKNESAYQDTVNAW